MKIMAYINAEFQIPLQNRMFVERPCGENMVHTELCYYDVTYNFITNCRKISNCVCMNGYYLEDGSCLQLPTTTMDPEKAANLLRLAARIL